MLILWPHFANSFSNLPWSRVQFYCNCQLLQCCCSQRVREKQCTVALASNFKYQSMLLFCFNTLHWTMDMCVYLLSTYINDTNNLWWRWLVCRGASVTGLTCSCLYLHNADTWLRHCDNCHTRDSIGITRQVEIWAPEKTRRSKQCTSSFKDPSPGYVWWSLLNPWITPDMTTVHWHWQVTRSWPALHWEAFITICTCG